MNEGKRSNGTTANLEILPGEQERRRTQRLKNRPLHSATVALCGPYTSSLQQDAAVCSSQYNLISIPALTFVF